MQYVLSSMVSFSFICATDSSLSLRMTPYHRCYFISRPESG